ncbi:MAG: DUF2520 domain-containing protein [Chitinophagales bacterium]|nr:DUF2520 domain-containing protein [Chitinophagales bacterium]MDW8273160.1 DUF2520 domain-containing protein [Chitinophagales bacterium]
MNITFIGSGNVAWHLAHVLKKSGHKISQVIGRNQDAVSALSEEVGAAAVYSYEQIDDSSDIIFICVKDDAIECVASELPFTKAIVAHTSGFRSKEILSRCAEHYGVFYPLQTLKKGVPVSFKNIPMLIEGSDKNIEQKLTGLASEISDSVHTVTELQRQYIHVAAVFANNFTNHLYFMAEYLLSSRHISFDILRPLIAQTFENIKEHNPSSLQTGPAARRDFCTIEEHLKLLSSEEDMKKIYYILTESILKERLKDYLPADFN